MHKNLQQEYVKNNFWVYKICYNWVFASFTFWKISFLLWMWWEQIIRNITALQVFMKYPKKIHYNCIILMARSTIFQNLVIVKKNRPTFLVYLTL